MKAATIKLFSGSRRDSSRRVHPDRGDGKVYVTSGDQTVTGETAVVDMKAQHDHRRRRRRASQGPTSSPAAAWWSTSRPAAPRVEQEAGKQIRGVFSPGSAARRDLRRAMTAAHTSLSTGRADGLSPRQPTRGDKRWRFPTLSAGGRPSGRQDGPERTPPDGAAQPRRRRSAPRRQAAVAAGPGRRRARLAGRPRPRQILSRPAGGARRQPRGGARRGGRPARPERRRQDHHLLHDHRAGAGRPAAPSSSTATTSPACRCTSARGSASATCRRRRRSSAA